MISASGIPITRTDNRQNKDIRQVARRLRRCASKKLSRSRGKNRALIAFACADSLMVTVGTSSVPIGPGFVYTSHTEFSGAHVCVRMQRSRSLAEFNG